MKLRRLKETLPLIISCSAVLTMCVLFFWLAEAGAALEAPEQLNTTENEQETAEVVTLESESTEQPEEESVVALEIDSPEQSLTVHEDTAFFTGDTVELEGYFQNDVIVVGNNIIIDGFVEGDVLATGASVTINATVEGDVRTAAGKVVVNEVIDRNLSVFTGELIIEEGAIVGRDVFVQAGTITLDGSVDGNVKGGAGRVSLNGPVGGDVSFKGVNNLRVRSGARLDGDLRYSAPDRAVIDSNAVIEGEHAYSPPLVEPDQQTSRFTPWFFVRRLIFMIGMMVVGVVVLKIIPKRAANIVSGILDAPLPTFGWGIIYVASVPLILTLLLFTLVGIPLSVLGFFLYGSSLYVAIIFTSTAIGSLILRERERLTMPMVLGVAIVYTIGTVLSNLPFPFELFGTLFYALCVIWAAGGMAQQIRKHFAK